MSTLIKQNLINPRLCAILVLGFTSGLPLVLIGATLQAWFTEASVNLKTIGAVSLLGLPYLLKPLWAPFMDHYTIGKRGKRKGWILLTQFILVILLFFLSTLHPAQQAVEMAFVALAIAFFSASQDIAIDAYRTDLLNAAERGLGASYYIFTYRLATLVSGGFALVLADLIGWQLTYCVMSLLLALCLVPSYFSPAPNEFILSSQDFFVTFKLAVNDLFRRDHIVLTILFIIFYKFGDALALSLMTPFLIHNLHFSLMEIGLAYKTVSLVGAVLGAFVGGIFLLRWSMMRALLVFGLAQAFSNLLFVYLAMIGKHFLWMTTTVFIENFCSGLSTAALLAFMMSLCHQRFSASQFAFLSAFASLGRVLLGPVASIMVEHWGWVQFYIGSFLLCFPGLLFLVFLRPQVNTDEPLSAD